MQVDDGAGNHISAAGLVADLDYIPDLALKMDRAFRYARGLDRNRWGRCYTSQLKLIDIWHGFHRGQVHRLCQFFGYEVYHKFPILPDVVQCIFDSSVC